jgi:hypothetical protein
MNSIIKFGKKNKHVVVPTGWVIMKPSDRLILKEVRNYRTNEIIYERDKFLNLEKGRFECLSDGDFKDVDGNVIDIPINFYAVLIRDVRAVNCIDEYYPEGTVLIYDEEMLEYKAEKVR